MTMPELPEFARNRLREQRGAELHPDANLISAFMENSLTVRERAEVLEHLSRCESCRMVAGFAMPDPESKPVTVPTAEERSWARWTMMRWATLAVSAVVIAVAVLVLRPHERQQPTFSQSPMGDSTAPAPAPSETQSEPKPLIEEKQEVARPTAAPSRSAAVPQRRAGGPRSSTPVGIPARKLPSGYSSDALTISARPQLAAPTARQQTNVANSQASNAFGQNMQQQRPGGPFVNQAQIAQQNQNVAVIPPPPPPQSVQDKEQRPNVPRGASETVEVSAAAAPVQTTSDKGKELAKAGAAYHGAGAGAGAGIGTAGGLVRARPMQGVAFKDSGVRWTISAAGKITRSFDAGQTWTEVPIAQGVVFRAISANGADIWAGGSGGALFHSSDGSEHWSRVQPTAAGAELSSDIIRIEFTDPQHGAVLTAAGERWTTADAGRTWSVSR